MFLILGNLGQLWKKSRSKNLPSMTYWAKSKFFIHSFSSICGLCSHKTWFGIFLRLVYLKPFLSSWRIKRKSRSFCLKAMLLTQGPITMYEFILPIFIVIWNILMMAYSSLFSTVTKIFPNYDFVSKHDSTALHAEYSTCY